MSTPSDDRSAVVLPRPRRLRLLAQDALITAPPGQAGGGDAPLLWRGDQLAQPSRPGQPSGYAALDAELPGAGWPAGGLTELLIDGLGHGELRLLAPVLARLSQAGQPLVWIGSGDARPYAPTLRDWGIDLRQLLWVDAGSTPDAAWAAEQALRADSSNPSPDKGGIVLCWAEFSAAPLPHTALRRLHLAAQGSAHLLFVLRPKAVAAQSSPAALRLACQPRGLAPHQLQVHILKRRGPPVAHPLHLDTRPLLGAALTHRLATLSLRRPAGWPTPVPTTTTTTTATATSAPARPPHDPPATPVRALVVPASA